MSTLIQYEYTRPGRNTTIFPQWLVMDEPEVKVLFLEQHRDREVTVGDRTVLERQAPAIWFVFPGAWHDVGRFHLADGTFTGWYTNVCTPVRIEGERWASTDLFLDHWLSPDGTREWLDEDELLTAVRDGVIDDGLRAQVAQERRRIDEQLARDAWPPRVARTVDLARVELLRADRSPSSDSSR